jgi:4a-hydroxytetrahydrobiopterin dehydratase
MNVGFRHCHLRYTTHSAGGLTLKDFICAACIDALLGHG